MMSDQHTKQNYNNIPGQPNVPYKGYHYDVMGMVHDPVTNTLSSHPVFRIAIMQDSIGRIQFLHPSKERVFSIVNNCLNNKITKLAHELGLPHDLSVHDKFKQVAEKTEGKYHDSIYSLCSDPACNHVGNYVIEYIFVEQSQLHKYPASLHRSAMSTPHKEGAYVEVGMYNFPLHYAIVKQMVLSALAFNLQIIHPTELKTSSDKEVEANMNLHHQLRNLGVDLYWKANPKYKPLPPNLLDENE